MKRLIIGCPFGSYWNVPYATSTIGTYTLHYRGGFWKRLWKALTTIRYNRRQQSWLNRMALPNPGITRSALWKDKIVSIHGTNSLEWVRLVEYINLQSGDDKVTIELNMSCPNLDHKATVEEAKIAIAEALQHGHLIIAKLPPVAPMRMGERLYELGIDHYHLCNTIPSPGGGISGKPLKQFSLAAIEDFRKRFGPFVHLIGGGGVTSTKDIDDYLSAGADSISIASMLLNPLNWGKVEKFANYLNQGNDLPI